MPKYYLKSTIKAEPLIWRWYAWPHLISPATAACNIVERHIKIMHSYVQNPQIHAQAVKDPKMLGGPFIDLKEPATNKIIELIDYTEKSCEVLIMLNAAIKETDKILQTEAKGDRLEELYEKIAPLLRGFIELVYDLNNNPSMRLIEPLIYKAYYQETQQEIALSNNEIDFRNFILSTPRLDQEHEVYLNVPFSDKRLDYLFQSKYISTSLEEMTKLFEVPEAKLPLFESFFTTIPPHLKNDRNYYEEGIRIRYFGHACILIQTKTVSILFDPVISYNVDSNIPRYNYDDLPDKIDYVIITHNHQDHFSLETLLQLRYKVGQIIFPANQKGALADPSIKLILRNTGFCSLIELSEMETIDIPDGQIIALPFLGEHADLNIQSKLSFCITLQTKKFMFAADSNNLDKFLYQHIFDMIGTIDMIFIGMECDGAPLSWLYGPLLSNSLSRGSDQSRRLSGSNFDKAWSIVTTLKCKQTYVYAMGQEPWLNHIMALNYFKDSIQIVESDKLIKTCLANNIKAERLFCKREWIIK